MELKSWKNDVGKILEIAALIDVDVLELSSDTISLLQNSCILSFKTLISLPRSKSNSLKVLGSIAIL